MLRALLLLVLLAAPVLARVPLDLYDLDSADLPPSPPALDLPETTLAVPALELMLRPKTLALGIDLDLLPARDYHWNSKGKVLSLPDLESSLLALAAPPFELAGKVLSLPGLEAEFVPVVKDAFDLPRRVLALESLSGTGMTTRPFALELRHVVLSEPRNLRQLPVDPADLEL